MNLCRCWWMRCFRWHYFSHLKPRGSYRRFYVPCASRQRVALLCLWGEELHRILCHPGVTRLLYFIRTKNLSFSITDVRKVVSNCKTCAEVKPRYFLSVSAALVKAW